MLCRVTQQVKRGPESRQENQTLPSPLLGSSQEHQATEPQVYTEIYQTQTDSLTHASVFELLGSLLSSFCVSWLFLIRKKNQINFWEAGVHGCTLQPIVIVSMKENHHDSPYICEHFLSTSVLQSISKGPFCSKLCLNRE